MTTSLELRGTDRWVRSADGLIAGVCAGLGKSFGIDPWIIRLLWLASIPLFGTGIILYFILAFCLPRQDRLPEAQQKRLLGVCKRIAERSNLEVGVIRTLAVLLAFGSMGLTIVGYVILHFVMDEQDRRVSVL